MKVVANLTAIKSVDLHTLKNELFERFQTEKRCDKF